MKIYVNMDRQFHWWMEPRNSADTIQDLEPPIHEIELDDATYNEYCDIMKKAYVVQEALEHMYRRQHGQPPYQQSPYKHE